VLFLVHRFLSPWWRRRQVPPKRRFLQEPYGVTSQKTPFFFLVLFICPFIYLSRLSCYHFSIPSCNLKLHSLTSYLLFIFLLLLVFSLSLCLSLYLFFQVDALLHKKKRQTGSLTQYPVVQVRNLSYALCYQHDARFWAIKTEEGEHSNKEIRITH
jgi:hypothetical protein